MRSTVTTVVAVALAALIAPHADAQALYLRPVATPGEQFLLIYSSTPLTGSAPAGNPLSVPSVTAVDATGKRTQLETRKGDDSVLTAKTAADTLFASADFGVSNRGEGQAVLVRFHAKCQPSGGQAVGLPVEITAESGKSGVSFVVTAGKKPLKHVPVMVFEPGAADPAAVTTDADGRTPTYSKPGGYAVKVGRFEKTKGEHEGRAYSGVWEYSTLVTEVK